MLLATTDVRCEAVAATAVAVTSNSVVTSAVPALDCSLLRLQEAVVLIAVMRMLAVLLT